MPEEIILEDDLAILTPEFKAKASKDLQHFMEILPSFERTYIIVTAHNHEFGRNYVNRISCKKGLPIGGYIYDSQSDSYHVDCADYFHLGYIPISFVARIKGMEDWQMRVPVPENVLKKFLTTLQKKELRNFKNHFKAENFDIQFIQMIDPN